MGSCSYHHLQGMGIPLGKAAPGSPSPRHLSPLGAVGHGQHSAGGRAAFCAVYPGFLGAPCARTGTHSRHLAGYGNKHGFETNRLGWGCAEPPGCGDRAAIWLLAALRGQGPVVSAGLVSRHCSPEGRVCPGRGKRLRQRGVKLLRCCRLGGHVPASAPCSLAGSRLWARPADFKAVQAVQPAN